MLVSIGVSREQQSRKWQTTYCEMDRVDSKARQYTRAYTLNYIIFPSPPDRISRSTSVGRRKHRIAAAPLHFRFHLSYFASRARVPLRVAIPPIHCTQRPRFPPTRRANLFIVAAREPRMIHVSPFIRYAGNIFAIARAFHSPIAAHSAKPATFSEF